MKTLHLFTNKFPYTGGEPYLETEIQYLSEAFDRIWVYPMESGQNILENTPANVEIRNLEIPLHTPVKRLFFKYWRFIISWWTTEFIRSRNRIKYLKEFRWNFNRFMGLVARADKLKADIEKTNGTLFYSYWFNEWATALAMIRDMGIRGRYVTRAHGYDYDTLQDNRGYFPFRYCEMRRFDRIAHISQYGCDKMAAEYPGFKNLVVAYLGVRELPLNPVGSGEKYHVVSCSGFLPIKRIDLIAEVLNGVNLPIKWTHFGGGAEMESTIERIKGKGYKLEMDFRGPVPNREILDYYGKESVDLFINLSEIEGIPVSMMEAGMAGIPLLGCDVGGVREIVNNNTGKLVSKDDNQLLLTRLVESILNSADVHKISKKEIHEWVKKNFGMNSNYNYFINKILFD